MITTIRPNEIATLLDRAPDGIRLLSLDCFDTLLWRATHMPQDVFAEFGDAGGGIEGRVAAEMTARYRRARHDGHNEATIEQIHAERAGQPDPAGLDAVQVRQDGQATARERSVAVMCGWNAGSWWVRSQRRKWSGSRGNADIPDAGTLSR